MQDEARLRRIEEATDLPLLVLALTLVPLLVLPMIMDLPKAVDEAFFAADWFIWAVFAIDYTVKLAVAPRRWRYVRGHPLELAIIVLPFLRPIRAVRVLRLTRLFVIAGLNVDLVRDIAGRRGTQVIAGAVLVILVVGATSVFLIERSEPDSNITSFGDAIWWGITTMTTVGYGDRFPVTAVGRGVAAFLMLFGIAALSVLTGTIAAWLVRDQEEVELADIMSELRALREEVAALRTNPVNGAMPAVPSALPDAAELPEPGPTGNS